MLTYTQITLILSMYSFPCSLILHVMVNYRRVGHYQSVASPLTSIGRLTTNSVDYPQGYPRKGLKSVLNAVLYSLPKTVGIKTECEVKRILVEDGRVVGVEADEMYYADMVIYTGFAKDLPSVIDDLPKAYIDDLNGIVRTRSLTIWLGLDRRLREFNYIGSEVWFKDNPYWAMPISNYDSSLAPEDKQLVGFAFVIDEKKSEESETKKAYEIINHKSYFSVRMNSLECTRRTPRRAVFTRFFVKKSCEKIGYDSLTFPCVGS